MEEEEGGLAFAAWVPGAEGSHRRAPVLLALRCCCCEGVEDQPRLAFHEESFPRPFLQSSQYPPHGLRLSVRGGTAGGYV